MSPHCGTPFLRLLRTRRSIRSYRRGAIGPGALAALEEALLRSPSSRGLSPWTFVFVTDRVRLRRLAEAKPHGAAFLARAALGIVVCGDPRQADTWIEDGAIAAYTAHLAAHSLGLGSCWIQIRMRRHAGGGSSEAHVRKVLGLPRALRVLAIVAVGIPAVRPKGISDSALRRSRIRRAAGRGVKVTEP
jgi:nitroreductase